MKNFHYELLKNKPYAIEKCPKCGIHSPEFLRGIVQSNIRRVFGMKYKGYLGHVEYDDEAKIFHGEVVGLNDIITFQGKSIDELEEAFKGSVDDYLTWCKERDEKPEKTFSGTFSL